MNDLPFGFSSSNDDNKDDRKRDNDDASNSANNPFGFAMGDGPIDPSQLGQLFSQLGNMFSGMGSGMSAGGSGPVNYEVAANLARQQIGAFTPMLAKEDQAVADAVRLAEVWLDEQTTLPAGISSTAAWTPVDWLENTLPTWRTLCDPIAEQMSKTMDAGLPEEAKALAGPMMAMIGQLSGTMYGTQLGQGLGQLAGGVLTSTDIGLPLAPDRMGVLLPEAIAKFAEGLDLPAQEIVVFLAAREAAHIRLFSHVPWLKQRVLATVEEYARGIRVDLGGLQNLATDIDPQELFTNPGKLEELMGSAASFEPQTTPAQQAALSRLETLLALIEGWVELVVSNALGDRIPSTAALTETMRRRRASGGPAEQTFATLIGMDLRPRKLREAATLWRSLTEASDITVRDGVWDHPDLLPDADDLDNPAGFIDGVIGGDVSGIDDAIAELERQFAANDTDAQDNNAGDNKDSDNKDTGEKGPEQA
ncbi:zinc-dependent metalloprotease [Gordonia sp. (in: high G+C Gram-positive bacteria)]|uniref:zinc-dependent metalloprotease n=1 Tax=Gordonia sp. (in: high G+C Gram-positive bacteria) TaxID=84139 RepID=UPI0016977714|nr:zinc-dependent metalloprotease [Gordonia sp. (in: high G+C Gram-positive bacteria)]NLG45912.1 zinc-dependent metalloprotease [Gordonia sp. (in: high G+C Gram-positive bacteria)]